jgi:two-component system response regulator RegX3
MSPADLPPAERTVRTMDRRLLLVDDDPLMTDSLEFLLQQEGYEVTVAANGADALLTARTSPPDLVLLDVGLPDLNGVEVCRRLRLFWNGPVIVLTARRQEADKVVGLDAGADDYVTKPFSSSELLARIRANLRRAQQPAAGPAALGELVVGDLRIDRDARTVTMDGQSVHLSAREFDLLLLLAERAGMALPRRYLFDTIWGPRFYGDERALDVYIRALRKKIEPDPDRPAYIHTVRGVGYRLEPPAQA